MFERIIAKLGHSVSRSDSQVDTNWRAPLIELLIAVGAIIAPIGLIAALPVHIQAERWAVIAFGVGTWALFLFALVFRRGGYTWRAGLLLVALYSTSTVFIISLGPDYVRPVWFTFCALVATLLFGMRAAVLAPLLSATIMYLVFLLSDPTDPIWIAEHDAPPGTWIMFLANFVVLTYGSCLLVAAIVQQLERALSEERRAQKKLKLERTALQDAYEKLRKENDKRLQLQARLEQAQKLEAIGTMAGTMAHDLNNLLSPITGYADLCKSSLPEGAPEQEHLDRVLIASARARSLVSKVLMFGRKIKQSDEKIHLGPLLAEVLDQIKPSLSKRMTAQMDRSESELWITGDRTALHQLLMNLAQNAISVMEQDGGQLTFGLGRHERPDLLPDWGSQLPEGQSFAMIQVTDTGPGMDQETARKAFEPFFTTKPFGQGTGLGLATAQRVAVALGGLVDFDTEPGQGTTFKVVLPLSPYEPSA